MSQKGFCSSSLSWIRCDDSEGWRWRRMMLSHCQGSLNTPWPEKTNLWIPSADEKLTCQCMITKDWRAQSPCPPLRASFTFQWSIAVAQQWITKGRRDHNVFVVVLSHRLNASNLRGSTDVVNADRCLNILIYLSKCHHRYRKNKHSSNSVHSSYLFLNSHSSALTPSLPFLVERGNVSQYWKQRRLSFLLQCHFNKCLMPALREDYVDKAASGDLWVTCDKLWRMEVMVGGTHGYIFALFMPLYLFISLSVLISLLQLFFFSFFCWNF